MQHWAEARQYQGSAFRARPGWGDNFHFVSSICLMTSADISRRALLSMASVFALPPATLLSRGLPRKPWIDGLSFLPSDLRDVTAAGLNAMICDVSEVDEVKDAQGHPHYIRTFAANDKALKAAKSRIVASSDLYIAHKGSDIGTRPGCATFLQFQSSEILENQLDRIAYFHGHGLRILQLTHHNNNGLAGGAIEPAQSGLTTLGRDAVLEMNRVGMLIDVAHGSGDTIVQTARLSRAPVVYSHGACRAIVDHPRCISDDGIRAIADSGGVVGIFMMSFWLTRAPEPKAEHLINQLKHVIRVGGVEAVALANDFPVRGHENLIRLNNNNREGVKEYLAWWHAMNARGVPGFSWTPEHVVIPTFNSVDRMGRIAIACKRAGLRSAQVDRIMGGNWQRVLTDSLG